MDGQTVVSYNDIVIRNAQTLRFEQETIYDPSDSDAECWKFTIRVAGNVHGNTANSRITVFPNPGGSSAAQHELEVRKRLSEPRGVFSMRMGADFVTGAGGVELLRAEPLNTQSRVNEGLGFGDVKNGPKPRLISLNTIAADNVYRIEFEIELHVVECPGSGSIPNSSHVLNNRWSCADEVDENFRTTRTFTGRLRLSNSIIEPHTFRGWVVPALLPGMRVKRMSFSSATNGLELQYTVVHEEALWSAPPPATNWSIRHTESLGENGMMAYGEISIMLQGDRNANRQLLISMAVDIFYAKLIRGAIVGAGGDDTESLIAFTVVDYHGTNDNKIELNARVRHFPADSDTPLMQRAFQFVTEQLGRPIDAADFENSQNQFRALQNYNPDLSEGGRPGQVAPLSGPVSLAGAFSAYLQTPCDANHAIPTSRSTLVDFTEGDDSESDTQNPPFVRARVVDTLSENDPEYLSSAHKTASFTFYQLENQYFSDHHKAHLPIGGSDTNSSVIVKLARSTSTRRVMVSAERIGQWPVIPSPQDSFTDPTTQIEHHLLKSTIQPASRERAPDGTILHRLSVQYDYALNREITVADELRIGDNPWENLGLERLPTSVYSGGLP